MSTKIYNGYKLTQMSFKQLHNFMQNVRIEMQKTHVELCKSLLIKRSVALIDMYYLYGKEELETMMKNDGFVDFKDSSSAYFSAYFEIMKKSKEHENSDLAINNTYDFKSTACLFPSKGKILAVFFTSQDEFLEVWNSIDGILEYSYYNNVDKPDKIKESEWNQRRKDWKNALPGLGIPSENGFIVEFTKGFASLIDMRLDDGILKYILPFETRINHYSKSNVMNKKFNEMRANVSDDELMGVYSDVCEWLKTEEGINAINQESLEVGKILIPEITIDILKTPFKDLNK